MAVTDWFGLAVPRLPHIQLPPLSPREAPYWANVKVAFYTFSVSTCRVYLNMFYFKNGQSSNVNRLKGITPSYAQNMDLSDVFRSAIRGKYSSLALYHPQLIPYFYIPFIMSVFDAGHNVWYVNIAVKWMFERTAVHTHCLFCLTVHCAQILSVLVRALKWSQESKQGFFIL